MSSQRKIAANRANARLSSGPRSTEGKRRSARNAAKHNLSVPVLRDPHLAEEVRRLAEQITGGRLDLFEAAAAVAEAQLDLERVRRARSEVIRRALESPYHLTKAEHAKMARLLCRCLSDSPSFSRDAGSWVEALLGRDQETKSESYARVLIHFAGQLARLDRYERRTLSRRKFAIRRFDAVKNGA